MRDPEFGEMTIRPIEPADYDAVLALWRAAGLSVRPTGRDARAAFETQLRAFPKTYLAAVDGKRLVGVVLGTHDARKGWINRLAVHPDCRRRGVAQQLVRACEEALRAEGIEIVAALVEPENEASAALFRAAGYTDDVSVIYFRKRSRPDI
jgi:ribosomal protein S18 acetylase RimI-like enzyme